MALSLSKSKFLEELIVHQNSCQSRKQAGLKIDTNRIRKILLQEVYYQLTITNYPFQLTIYSKNHNDNISF